MRATRLLSIAAAAFALVALTAPMTAAAAPLPPGQDPFYAYSGAQPLAQIAPGTVLRSRTVVLGLGTTPTPVNAVQLLYRTTDQVGDASATVTTVLTPPTPAVLPRVVGYLSFYDGLSPRCDPSYTLAGGNAGGMDEQEAEEEELQILHYLAQGFIVTIPDFEGTGLHWMAGRESGYSAIDAARATTAYLHLATTTPVGLTGYSGGAVAANWAGELAPSYAPQLDLVGIAMGGIPVDYWHMFAYIDGTDEYSSAIPGMLLGLARAYHLDLSSYLSAYGLQVVKAEQGMCIASTFGHYPGLTIAKIMRPPYQDLRTVPAFVRMLDEQIMGSAPGHPRVPILMGNGNSDGKGDGVMRADDVAALAHAYCAEGVPVEVQTYPRANHITAGAFFDPQTGPFFQERFAGVPFVDGCASIGAGDSIAPVSVPAAQPAVHHGPSSRHVAATRPATLTRSSGALAATGLPDGVPIAALLVALAGLLARRRRA